MPVEVSAMRIRTAERRHSPRIAAVHPMAVRTPDGRVLVRGWTVNISGSGVFVVANGRCRLPQTKEVTVEMTVPAPSNGRGRGGANRMIRYAGRIVRTQRLGELMGLGIEFLKKSA